MSSTIPSPAPPTERELIHRVNNFLSLVMTTSEAALDERLRYEPDRALRQILDGAGELTAFLRDSRGAEGSSVG